MIVIQLRNITHSTKDGIGFDEAQKKNSNLFSHYGNNGHTRVAYPKDVRQMNNNINFSLKGKN